MPNDSRFAVYFSHSWRPRDVDLNLQVWEDLKDQCEILVDAPEEPGANPPYYINRIEELLRRTDLFLSVLTYRDPPKGEFAGPDSHLQCSPYMLFEIRLAERAEIPRLILYERSTGFRPPRNQRPWETYAPFDRGRNERLPEKRQWTTVIRAKIQQWQGWAAEHRRPVSYEQSTSALVLVDASSGDSLSKILETTLDESGYEPVRCDPRQQRSSEAYRKLREAGLIIAEFGTPTVEFDELYAAAHALGIPAIRMMATGDGKRELPWILSGDPGGYQNDIVVWKEPEELPPLLKPRIASMFHLSPALRDEEAVDYLQSKRYSQFFVFLSHTLKPPQRALVERIFERLKKQDVTPFEYHEVNTAGIDWRKSLEESLQKTTHFVALLSEDFEQSETCTLELEHILARGNEVSIMPFMVGGRSKPNPKLGNLNLHHRLLPDQDGTDANAEVVVDEVMAALNHKLESSADV